MTMTIQREESIHSSTERLWEILADDFENVAEWATGVTTSGHNPKATDVPNGAPTGGRVCEIEGLGFTDERFTKFDPASKTFGYSVTAEGFPGFVKEVENLWTITYIGPDQSKATTQMTVTLSGPLGVALKPLMRRKFAKALEAGLHDLKHYAETGHTR